MSNDFVTVTVSRFELADTLTCIEGYAILCSNNNNFMGIDRTYKEIRDLATLLEINADLPLEEQLKKAKRRNRARAKKLALEVFGVI